MRTRPVRDDGMRQPGRPGGSDRIEAVVANGAASFDTGRALTRDQGAEAAVELLMRLPGGMLRCTSAHFPHVLQRIALAWAEPDRLQRALDELMYDERGDRSGFPFEVLAELAELRSCHERWVGPRTRLGR